MLFSCCNSSVCGHPTPRSQASQRGEPASRTDLSSLAKAGKESENWKPRGNFFGYGFLPDTARDGPNIGGHLDVQSAYRTSGYLEAASLRDTRALVRLARYTDKWAAWQHR